MGVTATKAAKSFSELLNRVNYNGETFTIERGGQNIAQLTPIEPTGPTLGEWLKSLEDLPPCTDPGYADDVEWAQKNQPLYEAQDWS